MLEAIPMHGGGDGPESAMEAILQALEGGGYDQDCDAAYDPTEDVLPFVATADDPFAGTGGQFYDPLDPSTGTAGGMGFREDANVRVLVYSTDYDLRDPDAGYGAPDGCPGDAGSGAVVKAALDHDVTLIGVSPYPGYGFAQMVDLAERTGSLVDGDGDGNDEQPLVLQFEEGETMFGEAILDSLDLVLADEGLFDDYASVSLEAREDPLSIVSWVAPESYTDVAWQDVDGLAFDVGYDTSAYGSQPVVGSVEFALVGDGFDLETFRVDVEDRAALITRRGERSWPLLGFPAEFPTSISTFSSRVRCDWRRRSPPTGRARPRSR